VEPSESGSVSEEVAWKPSLGQSPKQFADGVDPFMVTELDSMMSIIAVITWRKELNSDTEVTSEFLVEIKDETVGNDGLPNVETMGIFEGKDILIKPQEIIHPTEGDDLISISCNQELFEDFSVKHIPSSRRHSSSRAV
jgi:hypothetical protein